MTLALLLTAVGGAWADDLSNKIWKPGDTFNIGAAWLYDDDKGTATVYHSIDEDNTVPAINDWTFDSNRNQWKISGFIKVDKVDFDGDVISLEYSIELYLSAPEGKQTADVKPIGFKIISGAGTKESPYTLGLVYEEAPAVPDVEVTTNAASEGATFTEASFAMPDFDATAEYELVRDMGYKVAFSGVPTRARLAKDGDGKFHFADGLTFQLLDNIDAANPKDITSAEGITFMVGEVEAVDFEGNTFYQLNKATLVPLADFLADAHLGNYAICAVASTGEYDGSFTSGMITLFQGYEVEVAAKEFITYYKDEPLYVEDEAAELYTIESVNGDQAVLSDRSDAMPSNTPMLVYNKSNETKVILLIPCAEPDMDITVAPEFQGTLTGTTIAASTEGQTNYAFNGKAFVFVKNAIEVGPNKAGLSVNNSNARVINLIDEATGISVVSGSPANIGTIYDLNGRKLDKMPTKKGVYILNGRKVVVK